MRRIVAAFVALLVIVSAWGKLEAAPLHLDFATVVDIHTPSGQAIQRLASELEKRYKGRLTVSVHPKGKLGSEIQVLRRQQNGEPIINFTGTSPINGLDNGFLLFDLPFAFSSYSDAQKKLNGSVGQELSARVLRKGFRILGWWNIGWCVIGTVKTPLHNFGDLKGLKIRVAEDPMIVDIFKELGDTTLALSFPNALKALESRNLDGLWTLSLANMYESKFYQLLKYIYWGKMGWGPRVVVISEAAWKQIPPDIQKGFQEIFSSVTEWQWAKSRTMEAVYEKKLQDAGVTVVKFSPAEEQQEREKLEPIWQRYESIIGTVLVHELKSGSQTVGAH